MGLYWLDIGAALSTISISRWRLAEVQQHWEGVAMMLRLWITHIGIHDYTPPPHSHPLNSPPPPFCNLINPQCVCTRGYGAINIWGSHENRDPCPHNPSKRGGLLWEWKCGVVCDRWTLTSRHSRGKAGLLRRSWNMVCKEVQVSEYIMRHEYRSSWIVDSMPLLFAMGKSQKNKDRREKRWEIIWATYICKFIVFHPSVQCSGWVLDFT